MQNFEIKNRYAVRIPLDADLYESIQNFCVAKNILNGRFTGTGTLKSAVLSFFRQVEKDSVLNKIQKPLEMIHLAGNISEKNGVPVIYGKMMVVDSTSKVSGGHFEPGTKAFNAEIFIDEFSGIDMHREYDSSTGLSIWPKTLTI